MAFVPTLLTTRQPKPTPVLFLLGVSLLAVGLLGNRGCSNPLAPKVEWATGTTKFLIIEETSKRTPSLANVLNASGPDSWREKLESKGGVYTIFDPYDHDSQLDTDVVSPEAWFTSALDYYKNLPPESPSTPPYYVLGNNGSVTHGPLPTSNQGLCDLLP